MKQEWETSEVTWRKKMWAATGWPEGKDTVLEIESASTRSHSMENWFWKRLWTCSKADNRI